MKWKKNCSYNKTCKENISHKKTCISNELNILGVSWTLNISERGGSE